MDRDFLIKNACMITGCVPVYPNGFVLVRNGRIEALGPMARVPRPAGAQVIDAGGRYVLPGFINPHMRFYGAGIGALKKTGAPQGAWCERDSVLLI